MGISRAFSKIESHNVWETLDGQQWRSSGNSARATIKRLGQLWKFLGNNGNFQGFFELRVSQCLGNSGWATMAELRQLWSGNDKTAWATMEVLRQQWQFPGLFRKSSLTIFGQLWMGNHGRAEALWSGNDETAWATLDGQQWRI